MKRMGLRLPVPWMRATRFFLRSLGPATIDVVAGESGVAEAGGHGFGGGGDVADGVGGVDLDELLEDFVGEGI